MGQFSFPFPGRELAEIELSHDSCYRKIPKGDRAAIVEKAWKKGETAADMVMDRFHQERDFLKILKISGLACVKVDRDCVIGDRRYFSDYLSGQNKVQLYMKSVALWAGENGLSQEQAVNLILSHEYYHYLEWNEIGLASRDYQVPMFQVGRLKLGRTGIRALSEIGAHAFARRCHQVAVAKDGAWQAEGGA